jgi:hypothetical protein
MLPRKISVVPPVVGGFALYVTRAPRYCECLMEIAALLQGTDPGVVRQTIESVVTGTSLKDVREGIQIIESAVTILGILIAGTWALFVFGFGRSHAGVVQVDIEPKRLVRRDAGIGAVVSVTVKNTGRTRVKKEVSRIRVRPMRSRSVLLRLGRPQVTGASVGRVVPLGAPLFESVEGAETSPSAEEAAQALEPGQSITEEVLVSLGGQETSEAHPGLARVEAFYVGRIRRFSPFFWKRASRIFSSRTILNISSLEESSQLDVNLQKSSQLDVNVLDRRVESPNNGRPPEGDEATAAPGVGSDTDQPV